MNPLTESEIASKLSNMPSEAGRAALLFAAFLSNTSPDSLTKEKLFKGLGGACVAAVQQAGWDLSDHYRLENFFKDNISDIVQVGVSVAMMRAPQSSKGSSGWGNVGKFAGAALGIGISAIFGF